MSRELTELSDLIDEQFEIEDITVDDNMVNYLLSLFA
ncbi:MoxR-like ATPase [Mucilaginibacter sp. SG538B]|jgi:hypothetical protein|uniref:Uncharacterized protein n=1 Tax=Mucilaginibacter gossypii TaxID=551996 RepID=A0A1G8FWM5_9SPHI|nr:MoxR-like ATPase [Mucilaginibacter sp. SG538B]SDH86521.1 hypothetical protein SAMN05192573_11388 [Mucilaginibacter gossypii]